MTLIPQVKKYSLANLIKSEMQLITECKKHTWVAKTCSLNMKIWKMII